MNRRLFRPADALLPLTFISGLFTSEPARVGRCFFLYICAILLSADAVGAFRNAASQCTTPRRVDRYFVGAILPTLFGVVAVGFVPMLPLPFGRFEPWLVVAAGMMMLAQLFIERLYALSEPGDAVLTSLLNAVFLAAGWAFDGFLLQSGLGVVLGALIGAILSIVISLLLVPLKGASIAPACLRCTPAALVQDLLYPAAAIAVAFWLPRESILPGTLCGMLVWRCARSVHRRSADESAPLTFSLASAAAVGVSAWILFPQAQTLGLYLTFSMLCAFAVFARPSVRSCIGCALELAAAALLGLKLIPAAAPYIAFALCVGAVVLNIRGAFLKRIR